jgi:hypothetical protein
VGAWPNRSIKPKPDFPLAGTGRNPILLFIAASSPAVGEVVNLEIGPAAAHLPTPAITLQDLAPY